MDPLTILRGMLLALSAYNICWTAPGVATVFRGRFAPLAVFQAAIFWLAAGTLAFQCFALFGQPTQGTRIASGLTLLIGLGAAASLRARVKHLTKFGRLLGNVEVAMAMVDLATVDATAANIKAAECRALTARLMANG